MFRRRSDTADETVDEIEPDAADDVTAEAAEPVAPERTGGPWDSHDPAVTDETPRVDLGSLLIPMIDGFDTQLDGQDGVMFAVRLVNGANQLHLQAFAAPKSSGLWAEVRQEIVTSLRESGGSAEEVTGSFGTELRARIPAEQGTQPARFLGADGPRWFLRGLVTGPASTDPVPGKLVDAAFGQIVVHRGSDAMAPRDLLPLRLPADAQVEPPPEGLTLELPERGPEITEIQ